MIGVGATPFGVALRPAASRQLESPAVPANGEPLNAPTFSRPIRQVQSAERLRAQSVVDQTANALPTVDNNAREIDQSNPQGLSEEERRVVADLRARDREVRAHEQAHKNVAGQYAGSISYDYQKGPDGQRYAIGGQVPIDVSPISGDPEATIAKMDVVISAALAPAEPSTADRTIAQQARSTQADARGELRELRRAEREIERTEKDGGETQSIFNGPRDRIAAAALAQNAPYDALNGQASRGEIALIA